VATKDKKKAGKSAPAKSGGASTKVKPAAKKPAPKPAPKAAAKKPAKAPAAKPAPKAPAPAPAAKPAPAPAPAVSAANPANKPKGITIVSNKPMKKPKPKKVVEMPSLGPSLASTLKKWKPLIPSGPNAPRTDLPGGGGGEIKPRSDFGKKEFEHYRQILVRKRAELVGDVSAMENQALQGGSGNLSHMPQHLAEQGSETFEQSLSLDLAQVDRNLIKEIDDALERINKGTYGICEMTGKPISRDRLDELPWTRYSIEAARARERHHMKP
jgi:RNA polymerase-binding protein DksA